tara:strand:- start:136 stop:399 length:264 start_codon:yes stop_codon:yes gene_type:complete
MKLFFYKSILIFFLFLTAFHFSFGYIVKKIEKNIETSISKEKAEKFKILVREEMKNAIKKDNYINPEDAVIINEFIEKIKNDLNKNK